MDRKTHSGKILKVTREHHSHSNSAPEAFLNPGDLTDEELKLDSTYFDRIEAEMAEKAEDTQNHHHGKLIRKKKRGHSRHHKSHSKKKKIIGLIVAGVIILVIILAVIALMF